VPGVKAAAICVLLGGSAIGYVYQKNQLIELGKQIQKGEQTLKSINDNNARLQRQLATLQSAYYLEQRNKQLNLGLVQPAQSQILTIVEVPATAAPKGQPTSVEQPMSRIALK
jgi:cell division protein FtsB